MMVIWRGFGIVVPIVFFISGWITSYWFDDVRIGNFSYLGWAMLWAGIALTLAALAALGGGLDENGDKLAKENKSHNDFFWIPIWVWSLAFIGFGIYFIYQEVPAGFGDSDVSEIIEETNSDSNNDVEMVKVDRALYFYNCAADSMNVEILDTEKDVLFDFYVQNNDYEFASVAPNNYTVNMGEVPFKIELDAVTKRNTDYNDAWMILCGGVDFVLVEATSICKFDISEKEVNAMDWKGLVVDRFDGDDLIEPDLFSKNGGDIKVVAPGTYLPQELEKNQNVYVLIPIGSEEEVTEDFLDKEMVYLSVR